MSSRLFQEAREKRGLCYSIHTLRLELSRHRPVRRLRRHQRKRRTRTRERHRRRNAIAWPMARATTKSPARARRSKPACSWVWSRRHRAANKSRRNLFTYGRMVDTQELDRKDRCGRRQSGQPHRRQDPQRRGTLACRHGSGWARSARTIAWPSASPDAAPLDARAHEAVILRRRQDRALAPAGRRPTTRNGRRCAATAATS